ncbi:MULTISPECIES: hypothetical protein [unclassified Coleofasciculus]|uniref:hypothetical protein n=1 Tax=unclassified Coleofasciculus TaxID=2692782 RepID=UPI001880C4CF|nr:MULTISPECIES: hypothetical protein [unclassified Coleofasciculus]MBE9129503.1 hypothetical protein [Coleofasciculus sp. LEGE 07081]MBE9152083.1 hypothetical protein [Coleofasciculus sp. LEGE 07092]
MLKSKGSLCLNPSNEKAFHFAVSQDGFLRSRAIARVGWFWLYYISLLMRSRKYCCQADRIIPRLIVLGCGNTITFPQGKYNNSNN